MNFKKIKKLIFKPKAFFEDMLINKRNRKFVKTNAYINDSLKKIFISKIPMGDKYPFQLQSVLKSKDITRGYNKLYLVGRNWSETKKPIALMVGFNDWKFGFVSDYLPEYRTVFTKRKLLKFEVYLLLLWMNPKPNVIIVWGFNDKGTYYLFSKLFNIPIYRMEDGFIRSANLGASHATPYSLILDKNGLYYNPKRESDIEKILNLFNFEEDKECILKAKSALDLIQKNKVSKYNMPIVRDYNTMGLKTKKRVAILGQVDNDAAIKYGNTNKWKFEDIIKVAYLENLDAEIYYRPHPEVYRGYQKSKFKQKKIANYATIASPDEPLHEFLESIDQVYVINSLSGLEALMQGKKVTVFGNAFYAGWGLTDDRITLKRRDRTLSLEELFTGVYILYPRYLANLDNSYEGLLAAIYRIQADKDIEKNLAYKSSDINETNILSSKYWVQQFFTANANIVNDIKKIDFASYLKNGRESGQLFQKVYLLSIFGILESDEHKVIFLSKVRPYIDVTIYIDFLEKISNVYNRKLLVNEINWLLTKDEEINISTTILKKYHEEYDSLNIEQIIENKQTNNLNLLKFRDSEKLKNDLLLAVKTADYESIQNILVILKDTTISTQDLIKKSLEQNAFLYFEYYMNEKEFDKAMIIAEMMLINGVHTLSMLSKLAQYAKLKFDLDSVIQLAQLNQNINIYASNRNMTLMELNAYGSQAILKIGENNFTSYLAKLIALKPNAIVSAGFILEKYKEEKEKDELSHILESTLDLDNEQSLRKAQAYVAVNRATKAIEILENLLQTDKNTPTLICAYTQALSFARRTDEAIVHIENVLDKFVNKEIYHEAIRLYVIAGAYNKCLNILNTAHNNNIELGEMHLRKTYFGNRMPGKAMESFLNNAPKKALEKYMKNKYIFDVDTLGKLENCLITLVALYGPGDEIRFASIYNEIISTYNKINIAITCSPKLLSLFARSFPDVLFIPTERLRGFEDINIAQYSRVRGSDLIQLMDNVGADAIENTDKVVMVTDFLGKILKSYDNFKGSAYLLANTSKILYYKNLLPINELLIGLSWRSSLTTHSRNEHYLGIEELAPLFEIDGVTFVNFQYDECSEELVWVEKHYPGKMIDIEEIDQYNDLDSVAALMKCMDLIIAPATTVVELAGALGCPTWMFSNSSEIDWRIIDDAGTDVWHNSIKIVEGDTVGDKISLVKNLKNKLKNFIDK